MLSEADETQLRDVILNFIGFVPAPGAIRELIGPEALRDVPPANGYRVAKWVLDYVMGLPQPDVFIDLVMKTDPAGVMVEVHQLKNQLEMKPLLWVRRLSDELWVPPESPFVDRQGLRDALAAIADGPGPAAITVDAPPGQGKRTMCAYIEQFARRHGSFTAVVRELRREPEPGLLDLLAADLRVALGLGLPRNTTHPQEPERHAVLLARELARDAAFAATSVWFVANIVDTTLEDGLLRFVDELLHQVQSSEATAKRLRVVLLTDEFSRLELEHLPDVAHRHILPDVAEAAVQEWLTAAAPGKSVEHYSLATTMVLDGVASRQPPPSQRLRWLARHCVEAHAHLMRVP